MKALIFLKKVLKSEEGFALPAALILLLIGGLLIVPASALTHTSIYANRAADEIDKSIYAADAGIEYAYWQVKNNSSLQLPAVGQQISLQFTEVLNGKNLTITIYNQDGTHFRITSTTSGASERNATIISDVDLTFTGGSSSSVFDYALVSLNGNITLSGSTDVESDEVQEGDIYSNGNIALSGSANVNGDASATGTISTSGSSHITGQSLTPTPPLPTPDIDSTSYENETLAATCAPVTHGSWTISGTGDYQHTSPVHTSGNLSISRQGIVTFASTVCVDGDLTIGSGSTVIFQGPVKVGGLISITTNESVTFGSTVNVGGNFNTSGNPVINVGNTVYINGAISMSGTGAASFAGGQTIVAEGNITLTGNSQLAAEELPFIMSTNGAVTLSGSNWTSAVIYAPNGTISLSGNSRLYGSAVGQSIVGSGSSKITYPIDLRNREDLPGNVSSGSVLDTMTIRNYAIQ